MASHEHYYVPAQSKWPIIASVGLLVTVFGLGTGSTTSPPATRNPMARGSSSSAG